MAKPNYLKDVPRELRSVLLDVTPGMAKSWLERAGEGHRTISPQKVAKMVRDIKAGDYLVTANAIGFDSDGRLIDGRHRLAAVVQSELTVRTWVVFGMEPVAIDVTDDTRARTHGDMLRMHGETHYSTLAAMVSHVWRYDRKLFHRSTMTPTRPEVLEWLEANPTARESVLVGCRAAKVIAPALAAACHYIFSRKNSKEADWFFEHLTTGTVLKSGSPILALRERLLEDKAATRKLLTVEKFALVIFAWNAQRVNTPIKRLFWKRGEGKKQPFPEAK